MKILVTRHDGLVDYLKEIGLIDDSTKRLTHVTVDDVKGHDVIGNLPMSLASNANTITEIPLTIPADMRGKELSTEDVRKYAGEQTTYKVVKL